MKTIQETYQQRVYLIVKVFGILQILYATMYVYLYAISLYTFTTGLSVCLY